MLTGLIKIIRSSLVFRLFCFFFCFLFVFSGLPAFAQVLPYMPPPGQMITPAAKPYDLPYMVGMRFSSDNIFEFTFFLNRGDAEVKDQVLRQEADKVGKYFLAALTIPEKDIWVNLSPYEKDRIITSELGQTDMGKDLLGEDYVLKQLASSLTHPDSESGKQFWSSIYKQAQEKLGTTKIPVNTFNKVWIVPGTIKMQEANDRVVINQAGLKVLTDEDYLATQKNGVGANDHSPTNQDAINRVSTSAMREVIVPLIEKEVNTGKHFTQLRQVYRSIIMAGWFKKKLKDTILDQVYFNQKKTKGAEVSDPSLKDKIYNEYVTAFNQGVYKLIRKEKDAANPFKMAKRQYFSGGSWLTAAAQAPRNPAVCVPATPAEVNTALGKAATNRLGEPGFEVDVRANAVGRDGVAVPMEQAQVAPDAAREELTGDAYNQAALAALEAAVAADPGKFGEITGNREEIAKAIGEAHGMPGGWRELTPEEREAFQRNPLAYKIPISGRKIDATPIKTPTGRFIVTLGTSIQNGEKLGRLARAGLLPAQARFLADEGWVGTDMTPKSPADTDATGKGVMPPISIDDARKIAERINGYKWNGFSIVVTPGAEGRAIIEISVPALTGKEGFTAKGEVDLSDPAVAGQFYDISKNLRGIGDSAGMEEADIMSILRKWGGSLPMRTATIAAKQVSPADILSKLSLYDGVDDASAIESKRDEASAQKFLKELPIAFTTIRELQRNKTIGAGDTYREYRYDRSRTEAELFVLSILFNRGGYPTGTNDGKVAMTIKLIRDYYIAKGILPPASSDSAAGTPEAGGTGTPGIGGTGQAGASAAQGNTGGFDFAGTQKNSELTITAGGVKISGVKAAAYLSGGQVAGFKLAILALRY